jgi:hypothetical protein
MMTQFLQVLDLYLETLAALAPCSFQGQLVVVYRRFVYDCVSAVS